MGETCLKMIFDLNMLKSIMFLGKSHISLFLTYLENKYQKKDMALFLLEFLPVQLIKKLDIAVFLSVNEKNVLSIGVSGCVS